VARLASHDHMLAKFFLTTTSVWQASQVSRPDDDSPGEINVREALTQ